MIRVNIQETETRLPERVQNDEVWHPLRERSSASG
jgi:hypothetical protein